MLYALLLFPNNEGQHKRVHRANNEQIVQTPYGADVKTIIQTHTCIAYEKRRTHTHVYIHKQHRPSSSKIYTYTYAHTLMHIANHICNGTVYIRSAQHNIHALFYASAMRIYCTHKYKHNDNCREPFIRASKYYLKVKPKWSKKRQQ